jgi:hypothetical protein
MKCFLFAFVLVSAFQKIQGFAPVQLGPRSKNEGKLCATSKTDEESPSVGISRRALMNVPVNLFFLSQLQTLPSNAAQGEKVKAPLTFDEAEIKFREGYKSINYLLDNYEEVCEGGGDNVRRYLGTIVSNKPSGLVGISKVMKAMEDRADDFIEFTETSEEVIKSINQADGSAYMAIFVTTSTSYTPPKKYFDDALIEVKRCKKAMEQVASMVDIKL